MKLQRFRIYHFHNIVRAALDHCTSDMRAMILIRTAQTEPNLKQ